MPVRGWGPCVPQFCLIIMSVLFLLIIIVLVVVVVILIIIVVSALEVVVVVWAEDHPGQQWLMVSANNCMPLSGPLQYRPILLNPFRNI